MYTPRHTVRLHACLQGTLACTHPQAQAQICTSQTLRVSKQRSAVLHLTPVVVEARVAPVAGMLAFLARTKC